MMTTIGIVTIGQSPRPDGLGEDIQRVLGPDAVVVERGALDGVEREELIRLQPKPGEYRLITKLRDGTSVEIGKAPILSKLQDQITDLEDSVGVDAILLMCTGSFPPFDHKKPLLLPQEALYGAVAGIAGSGSVGALIPLESQRSQAQAKWREFGLENVDLFVANPYSAEPFSDVATAADAARTAGSAVLFLDCFGYDITMKATAWEAFQGPVVLARTLAARFIAEIVGP
jgi:protein AroM